MRTFLVDFEAANGTHYELVLRYTGSFVGDGYRNHDVPSDKIVELQGGIIADGIMEYESIHNFASEYGCVIDSFDSTPGN